MIKQVKQFTVNLAAGGNVALIALMCLSGYSDRLSPPVVVYGYCLSHSDSCQPGIPPFLAHLQMASRMDTFGRVCTSLPSHPHLFPLEYVKDTS